MFVNVGTRTGGRAATVYCVNSTSTMAVVMRLIYYPAMNGKRRAAGQHTICDWLVHIRACSRLSKEIVTMLKEANAI